MHDIIYVMHKKHTNIFIQIEVLTMYCYQRLKDVRQDADLTQADVAKILNISRQHYSMYERGDRELPMHHFITLAKYYNLSLDYLSGLVDIPKKLK